jgi:hypothetical protein
MWAPADGPTLSSHPRIALRAHRALFDHFPGEKIELTSREAIAEVQA